MKQAIITAIVVVSIVGLLSIVVIGSRNKREMTANSPVFFYGVTCPHCKDVEVWMKENRVEEKIKIVKKEVYENQQNSLELVEAARKCGLPTNSIGVPFLYAENKCVVGTPDIISYLSNEAGIKEATDSAERNIQ